MLSLLKVIKRELKFLISYQRLLVLLLVIPVLFTAFYGYLYQENVVSHLKIGVIDQKPSSVTRNIVNNFAKSERMEVFSMDNEEDILPLIERGKLDGALVIPADLTKDVKSGKTASVFVAANGANMVISNNVMTNALEVMGTLDAGILIKKYQATGKLEEEAFSGAMPVSFELRPWYNPTNGYANFFLPGLIAFVVQQTTFLVIAITITNERRKNTIGELLQTTRNVFSIILGKMITYIGLSFLSCMASLILIVRVFKLPLLGNYFTLSILSLAFIFCICAIGIFLSIICKNSLEAIQYSMLIALPSFLLSGYTWPLQSMPKILNMLGHMLPLTYFADNLRKITLMGVDLSIVKGDISILLTMGILFVVLSSFCFWFRFNRKIQKVGA